ncbi:MAG: hypothetical protein MJA30_03785 [Cytophagales bacterium]|nr:hypothetical protein [Cytophagales bacterium]
MRKLIYLMVLFGILTVFSSCSDAMEDELFTPEDIILETGDGTSEDENVPDPPEGMKKVK